MKGECSIQMQSNGESPTFGTLQDLHGAAMRGKWEAAEKIFDKYPSTKTAIISTTGMTALHVAASCGESEFVEKLVKLLRVGDLEKKDVTGCTALHHAALAVNVRAAEAMVKKNPKLPQLGDMYSRSPLFYAAQWRHPSERKEMIKYLYGVTVVEVPSDDPKKIDLATDLILAFTASGSHDIALKFLENYPELALKKDKGEKSILHILASQPSAFRETEPSSLWDWIRNQRMLTETNQRITNSIKLVKFVCEQLRKTDDLEVMSYFLPNDQPAVLHLATKNGVIKLVKVCLKYFPNIIWYTSNGRLLLHEAIEHRQVEIFNYMIVLIGKNTKAYADAEYEGKNNTLHLAAKFPKSSQLLSLPDPAFHMLQELQWYKAVKDLVYEEKQVAKNAKDQTPAVLFFKSHQKLFQDAKDWMKNTTESCMVVAALVATVAFAAMITVPGGNDSGGLPILSRQKLFVVFSVSNAVSMISSAISLLMFLSVQTSRETEADFLSLPRKLQTGLSFLFIAVTTMMIAFGTAIGLSLQKRLNWAYIPITIVACCPALMFTKMSLPLFFQTLHFKSGPGIFKAKTTKRFGVSKINYSLWSKNYL